MKKLSFDKKMIDEAKTLADEMGSLKNSITEGRGSKAGFLGELALASFLGAKKISKFNHDLLLGELKIEVKSKRRLVAPRDFYEGSVAISSGHQHPDFFAFLSLTFEGKKIIKGHEYYFGLDSIWYCGMISYKEFMEKSTIHKKGERDPSNGFVVIADMRNIPYSKLHTKTF